MADGCQRKWFWRQQNSIRWKWWKLESNLGENVGKVRKIYVNRIGWTWQLTKSKKGVEGEGSFIPLVGLPVFEKHHNNDFSSLSYTTRFMLYLSWGLGRLYTITHQSWWFSHELSLFHWCRQFLKLLTLCIIINMTILWKTVPLWENGKSDSHNNTEFPRQRFPGSSTRSQDHRRCCVKIQIPIQK